jgi:hypothetical protein
MWRAVIIIVVVSLLLLGCSEDLGTAGYMPEEMQKYMEKEVGYKLTEFEMTYQKNIEAFTNQPSFVWDATVFWEGEEEFVPEHEILFYRAYCQELETWVFAQWNGRMNDQKATMVENFRKKDEIQSAKILTAYLSGMDGVQRITYSKYGDEYENIEDVYKLPKTWLENKLAASQYADPVESNHYRMFIDVYGIQDEQAIRNIQSELQGLVDESEIGISVVFNVSVDKITFIEKSPPKLSKNGDPMTVDFK